MQLTLFRIWWFAAHPRLPLRDRVIAGMWKAGEDTLAICDLLFMDENHVRSRVRQLRDKGVELPKRTRAESCAKRRETYQERSCMTCGETFTSEGAHHRVCDRCKEHEVWRFAPA